MRRRWPTSPSGTAGSGRPVALSLEAVRGGAVPRGRRTHRDASPRILHPRKRGREAAAAAPRPSRWVRKLVICPRCLAEVGNQPEARAQAAPAVSVSPASLTHLSPSKFWATTLINKLPREREVREIHNKTVDIMAKTFEIAYILYSYIRPFAQNNRITPEIRAARSTRELKPQNLAKRDVRERPTPVRTLR